MPHGLPANIELRPFANRDYEDLPRLFALLESDLSADIVSSRIAPMRAQGWVCLGAYAEGRLVAMAGYSQRRHLFSGPVIYVENVVVMPVWRSHKLGQALMSWIEEHARATGCCKITLDAYTVNQVAQAFYKGLGYDPRGVHFVKEL